MKNDYKIHRMEDRVRQYPTHIRHEERKRMLFTKLERGGMASLGGDHELHSNERTRKYKKIWVM